MNSSARFGLCFQGLGQFQVTLSRILQVFAPLQLGSTDRNRSRVNLFLSTNIIFDIHMEVAIEGKGRYLGLAP